MKRIIFNFCWIFLPLLHQLRCDHARDLVTPEWAHWIQRWDCCYQQWDLLLHLSSRCRWRSTELSPAVSSIWGRTPNVVAFAELTSSPESSRWHWTACVVSSTPYMCFTLLLTSIPSPKVMSHHTLFLMVQRLDHAFSHISKDLGFTSAGKAQNSRISLALATGAAETHSQERIVALFLCSHMEKARGKKYILHWVTFCLDIERNCLH